MDPPGPVPGCGHGFDLERLDDAAIEALLATARPDVVSPLLSVELRQCGGALGRTREGAGVTRRRDGFGLFAVGMAPPVPGVREAIEGRIDELVDALLPWAEGRFTPNFSERACDADAAYDAADLGRLRAVMDAVDPGGVFHATHRVSAG